MKWIFLPGLDGSGEFFEPFLKVLPKDVEPVPIGFPPNEKLGYDELFHWLLSRLPRDEPFLVIAESFSGPLAVRLAAARPDGMVGGVICASFVRNPLPRFLRHLPAEFVFRRRFPKLLVKILFSDTTAGDEIYDLFYRVMRYSPPDVMAHRARAALSVDETEDLKRCELPLLFIEATSDRLIRKRSTELVRQLRPEIPIVPVAAPHFLLQLRQKECLHAIGEFLRGIR